jgi:hypothetical protein
MATSDSGSGEELRLKITPELDQAALKKAQDQLNALKTTTTIGGTGKGAGSSSQTNAVKQQVTALKELLAVERLAIDQADLRLRKTRSTANAEIAAIRDRAAAGKISMQQMNTLIAQQDALIENAANDATRSYQQVSTSLQGLQTQYAGVANAQQLITNRERQLFFAQERLSSGFVSMSGSMQTVVSQTKSANIAFMNFGRIVQDAPFGLLGISNNIDPLLMSFSMLSNEVDKTTGKVRGASGAFLAMGKQLLGPAGVIFLLGSALPTALLFLQRRQQQQAAATKDSTNEAVEFAAKILDMKSKVELATIGFISQDKVVQEYNETLAKTFGSVNDLNGVNDNLVQNTDKFIQAMVLRAQAQILINDAAQAYVDIITGKEQERSFLEGLEYQDRITEKVNKIKETQFISLKTELALRQELKKVVDEEIANEKRQEASGKQAEATRLIGQAFELTKGISVEDDKKSKYFDKSIVDQTRLNLLSDEQFQISKDQNITWEERLIAVQKGISYQKLSLNFELSSLQEQRNKSTELSEQLKIDADILIKKNEIARADKTLLDFQNQITDARKEDLNRLKEYVSSDLENKLQKEKQTLQEILQSEFLTDEQKLAARKRYFQVEQSIFDEYQQKARTKDEKDRQEKLKKDVDARKQFVTEQEKITQLSEDRIQGRYDLQIIAAELSNNKELLLELQKLQALRDLRKQYAALGLLDTEEFKRAEAALIANIQAEADGNLIDNMKLYADAVIAVGEFIFGETKGLATAQVAVDTLAGIARVLAKDPFNPANIAKAVIIAANGATTIRKINKTKKGDSIVDSSKGSTAPTTREVMIEGVGSRQGQRLTPNGTVMSTSAQPFTQDMSQSINIDAKVDRRGLAIAVREGEREIRTSEFSYI